MHMNKNKYYFTVAVLGLLITTALVSVVSFAAQNDTAFPPGKGLGPHPEVRQAVIDGDYDAWSAEMQEKVDALREIGRASCRERVCHRV